MTSHIPPPPLDPNDLLAWAEAHRVADRLDELFIAETGPPGTFLPGRTGERMSYRQVLVEQRTTGGWERWPVEAAGDARAFLLRMATLIDRHRQHRDWMDHHGRDPEDAPLRPFLALLRANLRELSEAVPDGRRPAGTYEPLPLLVLREPVPRLAYEELQLSDLHGVGSPDARLCLEVLGWNEAPLRWVRTRGPRVLPGEPAPAQRRAALEAMIDLVRDPRQATERAALDELLRLPAWRFALGTLDQNLARLESAVPAPGDRAGPRTSVAGAVKEQRVAFRVTASKDGELDVEPLVQTRGRGGGFSSGARLPWFHLPDRRDLTAADRRAYQAYDDRFARTSAGAGPRWGVRALTGAQLFGILRALIDHPAVFLDPDGQGARGGRPDGARLDIRQGRLRLRFVGAADHGLTPAFDLLGVALSPPEVAQALGNDRHLIYLHRPEGLGPQVLLAEVTAQAAALVQALAAAPARFPPEAHDALATRLETLQEAVDIEFPSQWTRTITPADHRTVARLEPLASGALQVRLAVRPVALGPVFAPGEGPALVLEGQGRDRHGARRDRQAERQRAHTLAERLGLSDAAEEIEPWGWRIGEGDPAMHLVSQLKDLGDDQVVVEWADDARWVALGSVGRGDMRLKVADRRDWFAVEGGAVVKGRSGRRIKGGGQDQVVPLADLMAAIREERRYVRVGARGFVRIEQTLRDALERAAGALFLHGDEWQVPAAAHDALMGAVEEEAQLDASAAFAALRRRMKEGADVQPRLPAGLETVLRPYQRGGVVWMTRLSHWGAGAILADEMGLGKTVQTLAVLAHRAELGPALVVAPTSVVSTWVDQAALFAPALKVRLYRGPGRSSCLQGLGPGDLLLTSYALATLDAEALAALTFASLVLDEAQAVKNASTERAKALRGLNAAWRLGLTGTPIENHLGELWSLMRVVSPGLLGSWEQFRGRYAVPIEKFGDDGRRKALSAALRPFILRRTKDEVARDLPPRTEMVRAVRLSADEQQLYDELRQATLNEFAARKKDGERDAQELRFILLAALTRLRQLCCHPRLVYPRTQAGSAKAGVLLELLDELREGGHKVLVFSQFRSFLRLLEPRLAQHGFRALVLDGTTPAEARERRIAAFQNGEADVFLISLKAGGFGLNLTAADTVIHMDPWWNPAVEDQATARAHRIGQTRPVTAVRLVASGTIEEAVLSLHAAKRALARAVLEGSEVAATLGSDELIALIRSGAGPDASDDHVV